MCTHLHSTAKSSMLELKFLSNQMLQPATGHRPRSGLLFVKHRQVDRKLWAGLREQYNSLSNKIEPSEPHTQAVAGPQLRHLATERSKL